MIQVTTGGASPSSGAPHGIHEYRIAPGAAVTSPPPGMEAITIVLEGSLAYADGDGQIVHVPANSLHYQSASVGKSSRLHNAAANQPLHLLQCLLTADTQTAPLQIHQALPEADGRLRLIASPDGRRGRLQIGAGVSVYLGVLGESDTPAHNLERGHQAQLYLASGNLFVNGAEMAAGDAALIQDESVIAIYAPVSSLLLMFDLPAR